MAAETDPIKAGEPKGPGESLLLLCDIGNTSLKVGIAGVAGVKTAYVFPTRADATADSLGLEIIAALRHGYPGARSWRACAAASVVPALSPVLRAAIGRYLGCPTFFAPADLAIPLENHYEKPAEVGSDRLVGAWAARRAFADAPSLIVVDFGTAVTFDCVSANAYMGGLIFPGPATAAASLASHTAKLPHVCLEIADTEPRPCRDTVTSIRHGLAFGYSVLVEGLCVKLAAQLPGPVKIVATGGFAPVIGRLTSVFDAIMPDLLLDGLSWLYWEQDKNAG